MVTVTHDSRLWLKITNKTIHVPEDDDEAVMSILPSIWRMAKGKQNDRRSQ